ncbi:PHP domain-containing protein [Extibacter muris]|uniref:PHP domain-containing protein n=1 Tax=Extibacter muris TaxID=1796622 RepID=UPI001D07B626|nr:PHP domain-containing protein [Extibacter muris]MCB6203664.1 PHP domain-containing protein [Extibacter muris]MCQ4665218.1 PHP domain-containing protein [Extibacter muris]MCQ4694632.1 PHP domain-containing protein [Extibacter muris]
MIMDMHLHTNYSDGKNSILEMARCAFELGYKRICFTDHVRSTTSWLSEYEKELDACRKKFQGKLIIGKGIESKVIDWKGNLDLPADIQKEKWRIVAAIHRIPDGKGEFISRNMVNANNIAIIRKAWEYSVLGLALNPSVDCLAHPTNWYVMWKDSAEFEGIIRTILKKQENLQLEYNVKYDNSLLSHKFWSEYKGRICMASDSHSVQEMADRYYKIKKAGLFIQ